MPHFSLNTLPVSRWRNGGGETREIVAWPPGAEDFSWRISIATISQDGDFSPFPGIDRIITLLSGDGVTLTSSGWQQQLQTAQPFAFAGEDQVYARLSGGASQDFNLMTRRASHRAAMTVVTGATRPAPEDAGVAFVLSGSWRAGEMTLQVNEGIWWHQHGDPLTPQTPDARLLYAAVSRR
ncbi:HutD-family protein [Izhakiella australiensis]|uniref:HutD-family protein n=1 Tax=Izhakiella australiensis TaxID=1926881 RepID=A0A1S8YQ74_9GAMM|nr:HutD family protein [Izhakiella australiensis]OON40936.1 HutD-family protein [Izhakiella australiensis]